MDRSRVDDTGQWASVPPGARQYVAWNGQTYQGEPLAGWYRAGDGRWWPVGTGPVMPPPPMTPPPPGPQPRGPDTRRSKAPVLAVLAVVAVVVAGAVWLGSRPSLSDAATAARRAGCRNVTESKDRVVVRSPLGAGRDACSTGAGAAGETLGFTRGDLNAAIGGTVAAHGFRMSINFSDTDMVVTFTD